MGGWGGDRGDANHELYGGLFGCGHELGEDDNAMVGCIATVEKGIRNGGF